MLARWRATRTSAIGWGTNQLCIHLMVVLDNPVGSDSPGTSSGLHCKFELPRQLHNSADGIELSHIWDFVANYRSTWSRFSATSPTYVKARYLHDVSKLAISILYQSSLYLNRLESVSTKSTCAISVYYQTIVFLIWTFFLLCYYLTLLPLSVSLTHPRDSSHL